MINENNFKEYSEKQRFWKKHPKLKVLAKISLISILILSGLNLFSFLSHLSLLNRGYQPERYDVVSVELLIENGGRLVWSPDGDSIYYDKVDLDAGKMNNIEIYNIYRYDFKTDKSLKLIASDHPDAPKGNKGQPTISPSGSWLLFQGEYKDHDASRIWTHPGKGKHNNLWAMNLSSGDLFQLTDYGEDEGVLHPHFDLNGNKLCFSHLYSSEGWTGSWQINVADFKVINCTPSLENIKSYKPGAESGENRIFYETHDFSQDGRTILFTSDVDTGAMGLSEIYTYNMETKELKRLTRSWECHDEHANYSPDKQKIIWISKMQQQWALYKTDLLIMDRDGANKKMLVKSPGGIIADNDWSPDGTKIAFMNIINNQATSHDIYLVTLKGK